MNKLDEGKVTRETVLAEVDKLLAENSPEAVMQAIRKGARQVLSELPSTVLECEGAVLELAKESARTEKEMIIYITRLEELTYAVSSRLSRLKNIVAVRGIFSLPDRKKRMFAEEVKRILEELLYHNEEGEEAGKIIEIPVRNYPILDSVKQESLEPTLREVLEKTEQREARSQFLGLNERFVNHGGSNVYEGYIEEAQRKIVIFKGDVADKKLIISQVKEKIGALAEFIREIVKTLKELVEYNGVPRTFEEMKTEVDRYIVKKEIELQNRFPNDLSRPLTKSKQETPPTSSSSFSGGSSRPNPEL